jgi:hypothetical protein
MNQGKAKLTVFFEEPFWAGLYERQWGGKYEVCRIIFGAEPKDQEVYQYFLDHWRTLRFSPSIEGASRDERRKNPKRMQRQAHRATQSTGIGTKAQQALKLLQEQGRLERRARSRHRREAEEQRQFELRQEKRKGKHRGH